MPSTLVIKVKCGDTLRRFNTYVGENGKLELNVAQLREKIQSLFSLAMDDDFTLTYIDTDGDTVTLVEDCDLDDVVFQRLNPVRMLVTLETVYKGGSLNVRSSRNNIPMESPGVQLSIENIRASVDEKVKTVPEPLRGVLLRLTREVAATASAPVIADIIHSVSKIGESFACQGSPTLALEESNVQNKASEGETSSGLSDSKSKKDAEARDEKLSDKLRKVEKKTMDFGVCGLPNLNNTPPLPSGFSVTLTASSACSNETGKGNTCCPVFGNDRSSNSDVNPFNECPFSGTQIDETFYPYHKRSSSLQFKCSQSQFDTVGPVFHTGVQCDACGVHPITGPRFKSKVRYNYDLCSLCYQKSGNEAEYVRIDNPLMYRHIMKALRRKHGERGHRFQTRGPFKPMADAYVPFNIKPVSLVNQVKFDSRFILDVNVMDGTVMTPSVCFTKIWRMRNTGDVVWPMGTQLVWIDGDKFSNVLSVDLEIPADGVLVDSELDIAVDFVAPKLPGEYVSYWRMSSPSGEKFGQRVWVFIQVDALHDPLSGSLSQLNLNLPPQSNGHEDSTVIDINVEPSVNNPYSPSNSFPVVAVSSKVVDQPNKTVTQAVNESVPDIVDLKQNLVSKGSTSETMESASNEQNLNFLTNDTLLVGEVVSDALAPPVVSSFSFPIVDSHKIEAGALPMNFFSNVDSLAPSPQSKVFNEEHKELLEVGFNSAELNKEISSMNYSDLDQARVILCRMFGWDPILNELEEMGFSNKKKNTELVLKNKGSIKRVVMELVAGEKSQ